MHEVALHHVGVVQVDSSIKEFGSDLVKSFVYKAELQAVRLRQMGEYLVHELIGEFR